MTVVTATKSPTATTPAKLNRYPSWAPRFWHGMLMSDWFRLLWRKRFRVHPLRWGLAFTVTSVTVFNSLMHAIQQLWIGRPVAETTIDQPPIFVIGHWRSGTTLLHELMELDEHFAYPTTYECFAPNHFLITGRVLPKLLWFLLPPKRPMDDMAVSFDHPQEDEFALLSMGAPSPMLRVAFPNDPPPYLEFLDMDGASPEDLAHWKTMMLRFVRMQYYLKRKPIVLKSPPHTGRVAILSELFPGAKFIHIVRHPDSLFPSSRRLWISLDEAQSFQRPSHKRLDEFVYTALERMYAGFERQRQQLDAAHLCELRYEDLVRDPVGELRKIYAQLSLGDFEPVRGKIEDYMQRKKDYKPNRHELDAELREEIRHRWAQYFERYGYE